MLVLVSVSLKATSVRLVRASPVNTLRKVSKLLPAVLTVRLPSLGAVQVHQTDLASMNESSGSPGSLVAPTLLPVVVTLAPKRGMRVAKLSLSGIAAEEMPNDQ